VITPEQLQEIVRTTLNDVFDVLDGNTDRFTFTFDFTPIQASLAGGGAGDFANAYVQALPDCRTSQASLSAGSSLPVCREADVEQSDLVSQVEEALPGIVERMPSDFSVEQNVETPVIQGVPLSLANLRTVLTYGIIILGAFVLLLWLIDGFLLGSGARERFLWLGLTLLIPAGLVLLVGVASNAPTLEATIRSSILRTYAAQNVDFAASVVTTMFNAIERVRNGFLIGGGIPTLVAVLLLIFGLVIRPGGKGKNDGRYVQVPSR
jgi:hypothetical protein